ncbi:hypothetical protein EXIGLDRAFT_348330 [Exidia glandulosa HHB12029]|uniref:CASP C-terminal domain-containing protein n=1 Tax=Exidia glandulosa HHB12029 TaxID=1314781 RepID=A0A165LE95_EXIGL|nr:hypothetical protein EXIGLDRAFT_348330 [Exidia glandulosa HHB12029]
MRVSNESTQAKLMDHSDRQDQEVVAKLAEMDMIVADLERANSRVVTVERRNEILRAEIESLRSGSDTAERVKSLQTQISELEGERARVVAALETRKDAAQHAESQARKRQEELQREVAAKDSEVAHLKTRMRRYADYDEIKRELEIMKYVEFAGGNDQGWDADEQNGYANGVRLPDPNADKAAQQHGKSLEALLAAKNKRILDELTKFRIMHGELEASLRQAEEELANSRAELERRTALNEKLENDLLQLNRVPSHTPGEKDESEGGLASVINGKGESSSVRSTPIPFSTSGGGGGAADTSILPIVTSQRDRFRARNAELEEELRKQAKLMAELRAEVKQLQSDNLKLYEKVRYMQSYRDGGAHVQEGASGTLDALADKGKGKAPDVEDVGKYRARYEESMNPFERFRGHEAQRAVQALNPVERGVLTLTRHILGNRRTRAAFIVYAVVLHVLVVATTYSCAASDSPAVQRKPPFA